MGLSDSIPGVSGGTVALILGIYPRLIEALGSLKPATVGRLFDPRSWKRLGLGLRAPDALGDDPRDPDVGHLLFLGSLGLGVALALVTGARYIPTLLDLYPAQMRGLFLGLVLASVVIPLRMMKRRTGALWALVAASTLVTLWFVSLPENTGGNARGQVEIELAGPVTSDLAVGPQNLTLMAPDPEGGRGVAFGPASTVSVPAGSATLRLEVVARMAGSVANLPAGSITELRGDAWRGATVHQPEATSGGGNPGLWMVFLGGMVAISAMILPGISGSFVLLLFGLYHYVTWSLSETLFSRDGQAAVVVVTMVLAIGVGLLTFSRVLRWLFARAHDATLAVLVGLMLGSLRKLWPFVSLAPDGRETLQLPRSFDPVAGAVVLTFVAGVVLVLSFEALGRKASRARI